MDIVSDTTAAQVVTMADAIAAVEGVFASLHRGEAAVFPVVIGRGPDDGDNFGIKSGVIVPDRRVGMKLGSYWPRNRAVGKVAHVSTTLLLDPDTGYPEALVAASYLTGLRTAASDGVASRYLSRPDSRTIAIVGTGHQAWYELLANIAVRPIQRVFVWNRSSGAAALFAARVRDELGLIAETMPLDEAVGAADIIVTATASRAPIVTRDMVCPGTHISAMGSDTRGKQELDPALVQTASLFADVVDQAVSIGEFEHVHDAGLVLRDEIVPIGAVIVGDAPGRTSADEITIYDSSGMALQDLAICSLALTKARAAGLVQRVDIA